jgi:uncharacterized protein YkwD
MLHLKPFLYALPFSLLSTVQADALYDPNDLSNAYSYLNQLRQQVDMIPLSQNDYLQQSAMNHADYLTINNVLGHGEAQGNPGFTGVSVGDRALYAGYLSKSVSENISYGDQSSEDSIDGLMSAIYHRFGFLNFGITAVGVGISYASLIEEGATNYVYNMSNEGFHTLCTGTTADKANQYYYSVCKDENFLIESSVYEATRDEPYGLNPNIVLWPANNASGISPVFYEESPDPLPDYSISGYPISIQFNPLTYENVVVSNFVLYRDKDGAQIGLTRELNESTDPNGRFSGLEYALFPLERLDWNTRYRAELTYSAQLIGGTTTETRNLAWEFNTRQSEQPLYEITTQGETIKVPSDSTFAVYYPSQGDSRVRWSYSGGMTVKFSYIDSNATFQISVSGVDGNRATFEFNDGRSFSVEIDSSTQLATTGLLDKGDGVDSAGLNATTNGGTGETTDKDDGSNTGDTTTGDGSNTTGSADVETLLSECSTTSCNYQLNVKNAGFYVMNIDLAEGAQEGFWGISVNTTSGANPGGFNAGAILKENADVPGFIGFYLGQDEAVTLTPYEYLGVTDKVSVRIKSGDNVLYSNVISSGTPVTTEVLPSGFYVAEILSQESTTGRGLSGLSVNANSFTSGVNVGGWIDNTTSSGSPGFAAFYIASPQQVNVSLFFGETYGTVGSGKLTAEMLFQNNDGSRTSKWSSN